MPKIYGYTFGWCGMFTTYYSMAILGARILPHRFNEILERTNNEQRTTTTRPVSQSLVCRAGAGFDVSG
jgi:hypothetical protein